MRGMGGVRTVKTQYVATRGQSCAPPHWEKSSKFETKGKTDFLLNWQCHMEYLYSFMLDSTFIILPNIEIIYFLLLAFRNHNHEKDFFCLELSPEQNQVGIYVTFKRATSLP